MQRLGKAFRVAPSRNLIVKTEKNPKIGSTVIDENLKVIGKVFDVIGPVSSPYAIVRPAVKEPKKLIGKQLYLLLPNKARSKK